MPLSDILNRSGKTIRGKAAILAALGDFPPELSEMIKADMEGVEDANLKITDDGFQLFGKKNLPDDFMRAIQDMLGGSPTLMNGNGGGRMGAFAKAKGSKSDGDAFTASLGDKLGAELKSALESMVADKKDGKSKKPSLALNLMLLGLPASSELSGFVRAHDHATRLPFSTVYASALKGALADPRYPKLADRLGEYGANLNMIYRKVTSVIENRDPGMAKLAAGDIATSLPLLFRVMLDAGEDAKSAAEDIVDF